MMHGGIFWELPLYAATAAAERRASSSEHQAQKANREVRQLEERVEKLTMVAAAMWTLLKRAHPSLTDDQLASAVQEIDLSDGRLDGRVRHDASQCPSCRRPIAGRHERCLYCGQEVERREVVRRVDTVPTSTHASTATPRITGPRR